MSRDAFVDPWRCRVEDDIAADASAAELGAILTRLNDPAAPRTALDDVVTRHRGPTRYDRFDAAALYEVGLPLDLGRYVIADIPLDTGRRPGSPNNLNDLPTPFVVTSTAEGALRLHWTTDIAITHTALPARPLTVTY